MPATAEQRSAAPMPEVELGGEIFTPGQFKQGDTIVIKDGGEWVQAEILTDTPFIRVVKGRLELQVELLTGPGGRKTVVIDSYMPQKVEHPGWKFVHDDGVQYEIADHTISKEGKVSYTVKEDGRELSNRVPQEMVVLLERVAASKQELENLEYRVAGITHARTAELHQRRAEIKKLLEQAKASLPLYRKRFGDAVIADAEERFTELHDEARSAIAEFEKTVIETEGKAAETAETVETKQPDYKHYKKSQTEIEIEAEAAAANYEKGEEATMFYEQRLAEEEYLEKLDEIEKTGEVYAKGVTSAKAMVTRKRKALEDLEDLVKKEFGDQRTDIQKRIDAAKQKLTSAEKNDADSETEHNRMKDLKKKIDSIVKTQLPQFTEREIRLSLDEANRELLEAHRTSNQQLKEVHDKWRAVARKWVDAENAKPENHDKKKTLADYAKIKREPQKPVDREPRLLQRLPKDQEDQLRRDMRITFFGSLEVKLNDGNFGEAGKALASMVAGRRMSDAKELVFSDGVVYAEDTDVEEPEGSGNFVRRQKGEYIQYVDHVEATIRALQEVLAEFSNEYDPKDTKSAQAELREAEKQMTELERAEKQNRHPKFEEDIPRAKEELLAAEKELTEKVQIKKSWDEVETAQEVRKAEEKIAEERTVRPGFYDDEEKVERKAEAEKRAQEVRDTYAKEYEAFPDDEPVFDFDARRTEVQTRIEALRQRLATLNPEGKDTEYTALQDILNPKGTDQAFYIMEGLRALEDSGTLLESFQARGDWGHLPQAFEGLHYMDSDVLSMYDSGGARAEMRREQIRRALGLRRDQQLRAAGNEDERRRIEDDYLSELNNQLATLNQEMKERFERAQKNFQERFEPMRVDAVHEYLERLDLIENAINQCEHHLQMQQDATQSAEALTAADTAVAELQQQLAERRDAEERAHLAERRERKEVYDFPPEALEHLFNAQNRWRDIQHILRALLRGDGTVTPAIVDEFRNLFNKQNPPPDIILARLGVEEWDDFVQAWNDRIAEGVVEQMARQADGLMKKEVAARLNLKDKFGKFKKNFLGRALITAGFVGGISLAVATGGAAVFGAGAATWIGGILGGTAGGAARGFLMRKIFGSEKAKDKQQKMMEDLLEEKREQIVDTVLEEMLTLSLIDVDPQTGEVGNFLNDSRFSITSSVPEQRNAAGPAVFTTVLSQATRERSAQGAMIVEGEDEEIAARLATNEKLLFKQIVDRLEPVDGHRDARERRKREKILLATALGKLHENGETAREELAKQVDPAVLQMMDRILLEHSGKGKLGVWGSALSGGSIATLYAGAPASARFIVGAVFGAAAGFRYGEQRRRNEVRAEAEVRLLSALENLEASNAEASRGRLTPHNTVFDQDREAFIQMKRILHGTASSDEMTALVTIGPDGKPLVDELLLTRIKSCVYEAEKHGVVREDERERNRLEFILHRMQGQNKAVEEGSDWKSVDSHWLVKTASRVGYTAAGAALGGISALVTGEAFRGIKGGVGWLWDNTIGTAEAHELPVDARTSARDIIAAGSGGTPDSASARGGGTSVDTTHGTSSAAEREPAIRVIDTYTVDKGEGFLHTFNDFIGEHRGELLASMRANRGDLVDELTQRGQKVYGYSNEKLEEYVDKRLIHKWRVEQIQEGFGVKIRPGAQGENTFYYTKTPHVGAAVEFVKDARGNFHAILSEDNEGLVSSHKEKVLVPPAPKMEAPVPAEAAPEAPPVAMVNGIPETATQLFGQSGGRSGDWKVFWGDMVNDTKAYIQLGNGKVITLDQKDFLGPDGGLDRQKLEGVARFEAVRDSVDTLQTSRPSDTRSVMMNPDGKGDQTWTVPKDIQPGSFAYRTGAPEVQSAFSPNEKQTYVMQWQEDSKTGEGKWVPSTEESMREASAQQQATEQRRLDQLSRYAYAKNLGATPGDIDEFTHQRLLRSGFSANEMTKLATSGYVYKDGEYIIRDDVGMVTRVPVLRDGGVIAPRDQEEAKIAFLEQRQNEISGNAGTSEAPGVRLEGAAQGSRPATGAAETPTGDAAPKDAPAAAETPRVGTVRTQRDVEASLAARTDVREQTRIDMLNASRMLQERAALFGRNGENFINFARAQGLGVHLSNEQLRQVGQELANNNAALQQTLQRGLERGRDLPSLYRDIAAADKLGDIDYQRTAAIPNGRAIDLDTAGHKKAFGDNLGISAERLLAPLEEAAKRAAEEAADKTFFGDGGVDTPEEPEAPEVPEEPAAPAEPEEPEEPEDLANAA